MKTHAHVDPEKGLVISFPICKIDEEKGEVWGYATTEDLDQQGEIVDYEASKAAFSEWADMFNKVTGGESLGNIREMHQPKVVGKMVAYRPDDQRRGIYVGARVNRETADGKDAWNKVVNHELNGFSIGAPKAERVMAAGPNGIVRRVTNYKMAELSLVDNPACPGSFFTEVKMTKGMLKTGIEEKSAAADPKQEWISEKIKLLVDEGKPQDQAVAIAHSMWEERSTKKTVTTEEGTMDAKVLAAAAEELQKAGKQIGPQHHEVADAPGAQKPEVIKPTDHASPSKSVDGHDVGVVSAPPTQGKAAEADADAASKNLPGQMPGMMAQPQQMPPGGQMAPAHMDMPLPPARKDPAMHGGQASYCAYCGAKFASATGGFYHEECKKSADTAELKKSAMAEIVKSGDLSGLSKLFREQADSMDLMTKSFVAVVNQNEELKKRVSNLEAQPMPGGPKRTELPAGVVAVEKGAAGQVGLTKEAALEKVIEGTDDPLLRDALQRQLVKGLISQRQAGR